MDVTDTLRGGKRHELAAEPGADRVLDGEGEQVRLWIGHAGGDGEVALPVPPEADPRPGLRTGETYRFQGVWGCTPVSPVAGGADSRRIRTEGGQR